MPKSMINIANPTYDGLRKGKIHLLCGFPKTGKTTAMSTFGEKGLGSVLILDIENGSDYVKGVPRIPLYSLLPPYTIDSEGNYNIVPPLERGYNDNDGKPIEAWSYMEAIDYLKSEWDNLGYDSIAIDTIDAFLAWVNDYTVQILKEKDSLTTNPKYQDVTDIGEFEYALGYNASRNKVIEKILELANIVRNTGIVIIGSHMNKTIQIRDGGKVISQKLPHLPEKLAQWLGGNAETIGILSQNDRGQHLCTFTGFGETIIGTRLDPIKGKTIIFQKEGEGTLYKQIMKEFKSFTAKEQ